MGPSWFWPLTRWRQPMAPMCLLLTLGSVWVRRRRRKRGSKTSMDTKLQCRWKKSTLFFNFVQIIYREKDQIDIKRGKKAKKVSCKSLHCHKDTLTSVFWWITDGKCGQTRLDLFALPPPEDGGGGWRGFLLVPLPRLPWSWKSEMDHHGG